MKPKILIFLLLFIGIGLLLILSVPHSWRQTFAVKLGTRPAPKSFYDRLAYAAEDIVDPSIVYDSRYVQIRYPGGDVPKKRGVCADVVVRAYRRMGIDLQVLIHEDMQRHFSAYPQMWHLHRPDPNIDHRRVYNLAAFFRRHGVTLPCSTRAQDYHPGDIVVWNVCNLGHIGIVSSRRNESNTCYLMVHNIGAGQVLEDMLFSYPIQGHYRYVPSVVSTR